MLRRSLLILAVMLTSLVGAPVAAATGTTVTIGAGKAYFVTGHNDIMASFSSRTV